MDIAPQAVPVSMSRFGVGVNMKGVVYILRFDNGKIPSTLNFKSGSAERLLLLRANAAGGFPNPQCSNGPRSICTASGSLDRSAFSAPIYFHA
jgi:hypothetical protein